MAVNGRGSSLGLLLSLGWIGLWTGCLGNHFFQGIRTQAADLFGKFGRCPCELSAHGSGNIDHLNALAFQADLFEQFTGVFHPASCVDITFQVMAVAFQSTGD
jgi:hypothetical protein